MGHEESQNMTSPKETNIAVTNDLPKGDLKLMNTTGEVKKIQQKVSMFYLCMQSQNQQVQKHDA